MIPIRCFCGDRHLSCGSKRDHIAIFIFCSVILQLAILRFYLRTTGVLQQNGTLLHRAILVGHCEAYRVSSLVDCKPLANHARTLRVVRCSRVVKLKRHVISHTLEATPYRVAAQGRDLVIIAAFIKYHYDVFTRIVRPPRDTCSLVFGTREQLEDQRLQLTVIVTKEVPGICLFKMRRYSQSLRLGVRFAYSQCCRVAFAFGQCVDIDPAAVINHRIVVGIRDRPTIQPVAFPRLGCQRDTCPTGYGIPRACGNCTPCIVAACRRDINSFNKFRSKGNSLRGIGGNN